MPTEHKIVLGFLALVVAHDMGRRSQQKKLKKISEEAILILEDRNTLHAEVGYLCHVLNDRKIVLDEFDLIALPHVTQK